MRVSPKREKMFFFFLVLAFLLLVVFGSLKANATKTFHDDIRVHGTVIADRFSGPSSGSVLINDGTVGSGGIAFADDTDNGIYRIGADNWALSAGGTYGLELKFTTSFVNIGIGGSGIASAFKQYPLWIDRDNTADTTWLRIENASNASAAGAGSQLVNNAGSAYVGLGSSHASASTYRKGRLFLWNLTGGDGVTVASSAADKGIHFYLEGVADSDEQVRFVSGGVVIDDTGSIGDPHSTTLVDLVSTTRGLGLPEMTTAQRDAIGCSTRTKLISNTTTGEVNYCDGSSWAAISAGGASSAGTSPSELINLGVAASQASGALTLAVKQSDGSSDPTSGDPVQIAFRSNTSTAGGWNLRSITSALSLEIPSGATLDHANSSPAFVYFYGVDASGSIKVAVSSIMVDEAELQTTVAIDTSADARSLYSDAAYTDVPVRLLAKVHSTQTTAGSWTTAVDPVELVTGPGFLMASRPDSLQNNLRICSFKIGNSAGSPVLDDEDNCVASVGDNGTGDWTINFDAETFSGAPSCALNSGSSAIGRQCHAYNPGEASVRSFCSDLGTPTAADTPVTGICVGEN